jgi:predicted secreted protein
LDTIDVTTHDTSSGWREYIGGLRDGGEVSFDINFIPTEVTHAYDSGLLEDYLNRTLRNFKLVFPTTPAVTWTIAGIVTNFETSEPIDDVIGASMTIKVSGAPTLA